MIEALGYGVYTHSEAAKLTGLKISRVREWFKLRANLPEPIFRSRYEEAEGERAISFLDLVDVFVAGQLRTHGVSLQTLRRVYRKLAKDLGAHPFSRKELLSDGKIVYVSGLNAKGKEEIKEALTDQGVFPAIILPFLKRIDYGEISHEALRWWINDDIVLDPEICFGQPIVQKSGIPTYILSSAYRANENNEHKIAAWYNINPSQVIAAVQFESSFAA